jgi:hypothetical protein
MVIENPEIFFKNLQSILRDTLQTKNLGNFYEELGGIFEYHVEKQFETEGRHFGNQGNNPGEAWADLKPSTIAQREKLGFWPGKLLQRGVSKQGYESEHLGASFYYQATQNSMTASFGASYSQHLHKYRALLPMDGILPAEMLDDIRELLERSVG